MTALGLFCALCSSFLMIALMIFDLAHDRVGHTLLDSILLSVNMCVLFVLAALHEDRR